MIFSPLSLGITARSSCTHFPGTQMRVTPNYLLDENWNKSTVIDVKGTFFQPCKERNIKNVRGNPSHAIKTRLGVALYTNSSTHISLSDKSQLSGSVKSRCSSCRKTENFFKESDSIRKISFITTSRCQPLQLKWNRNIFQHTSLPKVCTCRSFYS